MHQQALGQTGKRVLRHVCTWFTAQCQLPSIARLSFHQAPQGETALNLDLVLKVDKQFRDTPFCAVRHMTWHLHNEAYAVNELRIRRLMRLTRLMPIYQKTNTSKPAKWRNGLVAA